MTDDDREMGVDFGDFEDELAAHDYPATADEIVAEYGDEEIELPNGETTVAEILDGLDQEFEDHEAARQAVFNMVGSDAVGREGYTDRDPPTVGEDREDTEESV